MRLFITILLIIIIYLMICIFEKKETSQKFIMPLYSPHLLQHTKEHPLLFPIFHLWQYPSHIISIQNHSFSDSIFIFPFHFIQ